MASALLSLDVRTYRGASEIHFFPDAAGLSVTIETDRLHMRSVEGAESEYENYAALFGDQDVMGKFGNGTTKTRSEMQERIQDVWTVRWRDHDPYAGFAVFKKDTHDFLGHVVLGHGDAPGESELAYLFHRKYWRQGYGSEAVGAIVEEYAPATVAENYTLDGKPLERIVATARLDNPASVRILEKVGMRLTHQEERYGATRYHYSIELDEIQKKSSKKAKHCFCCCILQ